MVVGMGPVVVPIAQHLELLEQMVPWHKTLFFFICYNSVCRRLGRQVVSLKVVASLNCMVTIVRCHYQLMDIHPSLFDDMTMGHYLGCCEHQISDLRT